MLIQKRERPLSTHRIYESSNGDTWDLVREEGDLESYVLHTANPASGGHVAQTPLKEFLLTEAYSPEHQAVVAFLGVQTGDPEAAASDTEPDVRGYIHDPKEPDGPYIAVVLRPDQEAVVTLHKSYAEAEKELADKVATLKQKTLSHELRDAHEA